MKKSLKNTLPALPADRPEMEPESSRKLVVNISTIVGIGASAGGLEALGVFLSNVPIDSGLGYVVIQHLDPTYKGMLPELLQRSTKLTVCPAGDLMKVQPNTVYVIPPNKDLSISHGVLHLLDPVAPRGMRLPIDMFFRALAEDQREKAVGVILSGMGSDGTLGLRAIKEKAGLVLAQDPVTAKFDSMPSSAIASGVVDIVGPVEQLPGKILTYVRHNVAERLSDSSENSKNLSSLEKIIILLQERTGNDFSLYKKNTVYRRIERRMGLHKIDTIANYVRYLRENAQEVDLLFNELLIGVSHFFRDPEVWNYLKKQALPLLLETYPSGRALRAWVPACSTGEEAYSLAMLFKEVIEATTLPGRFSFQVFATDLDQDAITRARLGIFPLSIAADLTAERLSRFFVAEENGYRVNKEIREMVIFAPQNIIMDPPFTKLDILSCRNLLIYLSLPLQDKLIPLFHYALNPNGILVLGNAETIGSFTHLFTTSETRARVYKKIQNPARRMTLDFPTKVFPVIASVFEEVRSASKDRNLAQLADQFLLQNFAPAAVLVTADGDILYINGHIGKYLEPAAGKANWNIYAMAREGLRHELAVALKQAIRKKESVYLAGLQIKGVNDALHAVNLSVEYIDKPDLLNGMALLVFADAPPVPPKKTSKRASGKNDPADLIRLQVELQTVREEMQVSQEELTSANEELQSINEELQSTNEELTTSKEEMQSLNEELQTVNSELQSKVEDLSSATSDMKNLLNSTNIATIFLDNALHVRRYTTQAAHIFRLIPGDAGRPLSDIVSDLHYTAFGDDAKEVLRTLVPSDKEIATGDGRWYAVRIMPYRTLENTIDGLVIIFSDISKAKVLECKLREGQKSGPDPTVQEGARS